MDRIDQLVFIIDRVQLAIARLSEYGQLADGRTVNAYIDWIAIAIYLIVLVIAYALQILLAPKPPVPKPASLDDFNFPTADQSRPVPVIFGTVTITGPNVVWYGDLYAEPIPMPGGKK